MLEKIDFWLTGWLADMVGVGEAQWGVAWRVFVIVLAVLLFNFIVKRILKRLERLCAKTDNIWDNTLINAIGLPLRVLIWLQGLALAMSVLPIAEGESAASFIIALRQVSLILTLAWFGIRLSEQIKTALLSDYDTEQGRMDKSTIEALGRLFNLAILITAGLVTMQTLGLSISGILAFGGVGGLAIGFAAKDLLANFFGGLMIYMDRPFTVGDWIRSPDRDIEGTVVKIGWRLTSIRRFDKRPLYVPNSLFNTIAVENPSRMTHRRIYETIGLRYDDVDKMQAITLEVREMLNNHPEIDHSQTLIVNFNAFNNSSIDFFVYAFTHTRAWVRYHEVKQDVLLEITRIIAAHGAEIAFPTRTLYLQGGEPDGGIPPGGGALPAAGAA